MRALLDTHVFLWWITDAPQLSHHVRDLIADGGNELFFSAASSWEIAIKAQLGKMTLPARPDVFIADQLAANAVQDHRGQPCFSCFISRPSRSFRQDAHCQSQLENCPLSRRTLFSKYKVKTIWARR
jgi:hypothetical protein